MKINFLDVIAIMNDNEMFFSSFYRTILTNSFPRLLLDKRGSL